MAFRFYKETRKMNKAALLKTAAEKLKNIKETSTRQSHSAFLRTEIPVSDFLIRRAKRLSGQGDSESERLISASFITGWNILYFKTNFDLRGKKCILSSACCL